jgi:hypothetical protein
MMEEDIEFEEIDYEAYEDDRDEVHPVEEEFLRVKSLILLTIFILPALLIVIEVLTGGVSGVISPSNTEPLIPPDTLPSVHF